MTKAAARRVGWRRRTLGGLVTLGLGYLLIVALAFVFQRRLLYFPDPNVYPPPPGVQALAMKASDGQTLVGWWLPPTAGKPTILFFGGNGDSLVGETSRFRACQAKGVGMLSVAYEGYSGSTGRPTETALHDDAEVAYAWVTQRVAPADLVVHGYSLGSGVAVRLLARHAARSLILEAPYTATVDVAAERFWFLPARWLMWDRFESRNYIRQIHIPLLVVHGEQDETIPFHFGRDLFAMANEPKTFVPVPDGKHTNLQALGLYDHVWRFLGIETDAPTPHH